MGRGVRRCVGQCVGPKQLMQIDLRHPGDGADAGKAMTGTHFEGSDRRLQGRPEYTRPQQLRCAVDEDGKP